MCKNLIRHSDYSKAVIVLSMGSAKKKPMTKKEREEKKAQGKTSKEVASVVVHHPF
jgi:DNA-binding CsgD family transcriptional regulator